MTSTSQKRTNFATGINESLIANINHTLRTSLNGALGMMGLLAKTGLDKNQLKYAQIVRESTENLMLQIDNILELAKLENDEIIIKARPCRLRDILKESLQPVISGAVKRDLRIHVEYADDLPELIEADPEKISLILTNILVCAMNFTEDTHITLSITKEGDTVRFTLQNSAILHTVWATTMEQYQAVRGADLRGFGEATVSLLTIRKLLDILGGTVSYDHVKDAQEMPFYFEIKCTAAAVEPPQTPFSLLDGKRALVLQGGATEIETLTQCLELWNVDTRLIGDQDIMMDELEQAHKSGRAVDLLFINGELDGKKLAALKESVPHTIIITADSMLNKAWLSEFSAHLIPPIYPAELLSTLSSLYLHDTNREERSLFEEASYLVSGVEYEAIPARVMVVEDDTTSRLYATELLEGFGCQVTPAENGFYAMTKLLEGSNYDLLFMDCMMPVMDGYRLTQKLRNAGFTDLPIIALTANTLDRDREKCLAAGMSDYITKPVREEDLHAMLKKYFKTAKK